MGLYRSRRISGRAGSITRTTSPLDDPRLVPRDPTPVEIGMQTFAGLGVAPVAPAVQAAFDLTPALAAKGKPIPIDIAKPFLPGAVPAKPWEMIDAGLEHGPNDWGIYDGWKLPDGSLITGQDYQNAFFQYHNARYRDNFTNGSFLRGLKGIWRFFAGGR